MKFPPILDVPSEIVEVRYAVPFGLDVAPKDGLAVCTKDGVSVTYSEWCLYLHLYVMMSSCLVNLHTSETSVFRLEEKRWEMSYATPHNGHWDFPEVMELLQPP